MTGQKFSREFKIEALRFRRNRMWLRLPLDLYLAEIVLRLWMRELVRARAAAFARNGQMRAEPDEIAALEREVARLRAEHDVLKKAAASFARGNVRFTFVAKHRSNWPVVWFRDTLEISRSGFHAWRNRAIGIPEVDCPRLGRTIEMNLKACDRTYGARRA